MRAIKIEILGMEQKGSQWWSSSKLRYWMWSSGVHQEGVHPNWDISSGTKRFTVMKFVKTELWVIEQWGSQRWSSSKWRYWIWNNEVHNDEVHQNWDSGYRMRFTMIKFIKIEVFLREQSDSPWWVEKSWLVFPNNAMNLIERWRKKRGEWNIFKLEVHTGSSVQGIS